MDDILNPGSRLENVLRRFYDGGVKAISCFSVCLFNNWWAEMHKSPWMCLVYSCIFIYFTRKTPWVTRIKLCDFVSISMFSDFFTWSSFINVIFHFLFRSLCVFCFGFHGCIRAGICMLYYIFTFTEPVIHDHLWQ